MDRRYVGCLSLGGSIFYKIYFVEIFFVFLGGLHGVGVGWVDRRDVGCLRLGGSHRGPVVPATLVPPGKSRTIVTSIGVVGHTREQHHSSVFPSQPPTSGKSVAHFLFRLVFDFEVMALERSVKEPNFVGWFSDFLARG